MKLAPVEDPETQKTKQKQKSNKKRKFHEWTANLELIQFFIPFDMNEMFHVGWTADFHIVH